jgi:hypothetical protein
MNDDRGKKAERTETNGDEGRKGSYDRLHRLTLGTTCHGTRVTWAPVPVSAPYGDVGV